MTLAAFYALLAALPNRFRYKDAAAAYQLGVLLNAGVAAATATGMVTQRRDLFNALVLSGMKANFDSITGP
jgi:hypothetical protein